MAYAKYTEDNIRIADDRHFMLYGSELSTYQCSLYGIISDRLPVIIETVDTDRKDSWTYEYFDSYYHI